jgi:hypothetical protein
MNLKHIWDVFGTFLFSFSVCVLLRSTGQDLPPILVVGLVPPEQICLFGVLFGAPVLYIITFYAFRFRANARGRKIWKRIPPVFNPEDGAFARWLGLFGFIVFPSLAQIHFLDNFLKSGYYNRFDPTDKINPGLWSVLTGFRPLSILLRGDTYRYHSLAGVTAFPFWQPWFYVLLVGGALVYVGLYLIHLVRPNKR